MPQVKRKDQYTATEIEINYEVEGKGDEVIVLHHGNGNAVEDWRTLGFVDALKEKYKLILIDSRGYGKSSKPYDSSEYNLRSRADDTIAVLKKESIKQAHCLGASVGAAMCFILARFYPQYFKSYIFATPYFELFGTEVKEALKIGTGAYVAKLEEMMGRPFISDKIKATFLANDAKALLAANSSEWFNYQDQQYIQAICDTPTLIYVGSREDSLKALQKLNKQLSQHSNSFHQLCIVPDATHAEVYWDGKNASIIISDFLNQVELELNNKYLPKL